MHVAMVACDPDISRFSTPRCAPVTARSVRFYPSACPAAPVYLYGNRLKH
jgi:hypothetical protein